MTPEEIATILEIPFSDYSWGFSFRFERGMDVDAFMDLCDEEGIYPIVADEFSNRVKWYVEESEGVES